LPGHCVLLGDRDNPASTVIDAQDLDRVLVCEDGSILVQVIGFRMIHGQATTAYGNGLGLGGEIVGVGDGNVYLWNCILEEGGITLDEEEKNRLAGVKNEWYVDRINQMDQTEILEGVLPFLEDVKAAGCKIALGSASKNAGTIIDILKIRHYFDSIIDGNKTTRTKPDPQVFELAAEEMGLKPEECIVFEDAEKGIEAALNGGFRAVGIGKPEVLTEAELVIPNFMGRNLDSILI
ncbi:MAG: HAD-IA family hydrolase, partial [Planctomycetaceae bacterium]|nr:HAD-IA family hydrolase [Planctomycetaceae bacterium]